MFYNCGNGYGIYLTTEEYFSLSDEEFDFIVKTRCFEYSDPLYTKNKTMHVTPDFNYEEEDIPQYKQNVNDIINILDTKENSSSLFLDIDVFDIDENLFKEDD